MSALSDILDTFRATSQTEREKGAYFENLVKVYLQNEPAYKDLFNGKVFLWEEWRRYPLKLFQRVITVSLETMKIVRALPRLDIAIDNKP